MVLSVIFSTFDNITKSLQHGFLQHSNFSRKVCNILLCNNWKIAKNSCNICLQQKCCKKIKFTTFFKCCKKKANVAKKKPMGEGIGFFFRNIFGGNYCYKFEKCSNIACTDNFSFSKMYQYFMYQ